MIVGNDDGEEDSKERRLPNLYTGGAREAASARQEGILTGGPGD
jgi:hypothetical protein